MDKLGLKEPLENWDDETLHTVVEAFLDERFPTIVVSFNKILIINKKIKTYDDL